MTQTPDRAISAENRNFPTLTWLTCAIAMAVLASTLAFAIGWLVLIVVCVVTSPQPWLRWLVGVATILLLVSLSLGFGF